jgi:hypothetical protein
LRRAHHLYPDALTNGGHAVGRFAPDDFAHPTAPEKDVDARHKAGMMAL